jgi:hypothetical protein
LGFLRVSKQPEAAVSVVHNEALPSYSEKGLEVKSVLPTTARNYAEAKATPPTGSIWSSTRSSTAP